MIQALGVNMALQAGSQIVKGISGIVSGIAGSRQRRNEQAAAARSYDSAMARFNNVDTSNPYANITNPYANLAVNQQQADFMAQQTNQAAANTMSTMNAAAGGSGIASLAQAMANQQTRGLQQASASIGQQEAANQRLMAQGAMQTQMAKAQGHYMSQRMQAGQATTQLGMAQQRKAAADLARQQATAAIVGGVGNIAGGAMSAVAAVKAMESVGMNLFGKGGDPELVKELAKINADAGGDGNSSGGGGKNTSRNPYAKSYETDAYNANLKSFLGGDTGIGGIDNKAQDVLNAERLANLTNTDYMKQAIAGGFMEIPEWLKTGDYNAWKKDPNSKGYNIHGMKID